MNDPKPKNETAGKLRNPLPATTAASSPEERWRTWAYQNGVKLDLIRPSKRVESLNGRLRDEFLNGEIFFGLADARDKLERWRWDYNEQRPRSSLDETGHSRSLRVDQSLEVIASIVFRRGFKTLQSLKSYKFLRLPLYYLAASEQR